MTPTEGETADMERPGVDPEDIRLWKVFQQLVDERGPVNTASSLRVNYRTVAANLREGRLSPRMRKALREFEAASEPAEADRHGSGIRDRDNGAAQQMERLEANVAHLRQMMEGQSGVLQELGGRVTGLEELVGELLAANWGPAADEVVAGQWSPPERGQGLPPAGVVTVQPQPDEEHAFGPAAPLVAEWRKLYASRRRRAGDVTGRREEERMWELCVLLMDGYELTLPPHSEPLRAPKREVYLQRMKKVLAGARAKRVTAERRRNGAGG